MAKSTQSRPSAEKNDITISSSTKSSDKTDRQADVAPPVLSPLESLKPADVACFVTSFLASCSTTTILIRIIVVPVLLCVGLYGGALLSLIPAITQRNALYLHNLHSTSIWNLDQPEWWGFGRGQVTPIHINSTDNAVLYGWHVLPVRKYLQHAQELSALPTEQTLSFELLKSDPDARLVIFFHGTAGNIADSVRANLMQTLTSLSTHLHILTVDYRGFGRSSGSPSEAGLIADGIATVAFVLDQLGLTEDRIVIVGHSLGTAVASAVALHYATADLPEPPSALLPLNRTDLYQNLVTSPFGLDGSLRTDLQATDGGISQLASRRHVFRKLILVSAFHQIDSLLANYRLAEIIPILGPVKLVPGLMRVVVAFFLDKWDTAARLTQFVDAAILPFISSSSCSGSDDEAGQRGSLAKLDVEIVHALDDRAIGFGHSVTLFRDSLDAASCASEEIDVTDHSELSSISIKTPPRTSHTDRERTWAWSSRLFGSVRLRLMPFGTHTNVLLSTSLSAIILDAFSGLDG